MGNPGNAGGPAHTPQWCQPGPATPGPSGGRKCHSKCHHSGENKPNEMKQFLWGWGAAILATAGDPAQNQGCRVRAHPRGDPQAGVYAPQGSGDPMELGTWLNPEPGGLGMDMKGLTQGWFGRVWGKWETWRGGVGDWMDPGCPCPSSLRVTSPKHTPVHSCSIPTALPWHRHLRAAHRAPGSCQPPSQGVPAPHPAPLTRTTAPTAWAQAPVRYFGKDEPRRAWGLPPSGGDGSGLREKQLGEGIAPRDLPGHRPRGAWHGDAAAPANPTEGKTAAGTRSDLRGTRAPAAASRPPGPTRWSRTPAAPAGLRGCGTAGRG